MHFENNESLYSTSLSSSSSASQLSPCTPMTSPKPQPSISSHKRKAGRKKFRVTRHPVYMGVRQRNGNRWVCEIREPNKKSRIWLGTYPTPEMAARAHDVAVLALRGTSAKFNFPESALFLPVAKSCSAIDIRAAAAKATTEAFKTSTNLSLSGSNFFGKNVCAEDPCLVDLKNHERVLSSCLNISMQGLEGSLENDVSQTKFLDEEALYNMPGLLDSMAEGLLITPPSMKSAMDWDNIGCEVDLTLWVD